MKLSASPLLPMRRLVIGATDEPVAQAAPKAVFFDVPVPALGLHYSKFDRTGEACQLQSPAWQNPT